MTEEELPELEQLARQLGAALYRMARRWGLAVEDAEDVAQDVLLCFFLRLSSPTRPEPESVLPTLTKAAWGRAVELRRRDAVLEALELHEEVLATVDGHGDDCPDPERGRRDGLVSRAIVCLSEADRDIIERRYRCSNEQMLHREIADEIGISPAAARKRYERAVDRLRAHIVRDSEYDPVRDGPLF